MDETWMRFGRRRAGRTAWGPNEWKQSRPVVDYFRELEVRWLRRWFPLMLSRREVFRAHRQFLERAGKKYPWVQRFDDLPSFVVYNDGMIRGRALMDDDRGKAAKQIGRELRRLDKLGKGA